jgi:hypothetical protein
VFRIANLNAGNVYTSNFTTEAPQQPNYLNQMMTLFRSPIGMLLIVLMTNSIMLSGCDSSKTDDSPGDPELITKAELLLTRTDQSGSTSANALSANGLASGGNVVTTTLNLQVGATYRGRLELTGASNEDLREEIFQERNEHQVFYSVLPSSLALDVTITTLDSDANELPVGLDFDLVVSGEAIGTGSISIDLSHYNEQAKDGTTRATNKDLNFQIPIKIN